MATSLKKLTGMGGDVRKLAKLLQAKAPKGEMLAYINPREAALLKAHGGSGKPDEETGIPSFQDGPPEGPSDYESSQMTDTSTPSDTTTSDNTVTPVTADFTSAAAPEPSGGSADRAAVFGPVGYGEGIGATPESAYSLPAREAFDTAMARQAVTGAPQEEGLAAKAAKATGLKEETLGRLGIAGIQGLLGSRAASKAATEGQQGRADIQALATPYQQKGQALQAQAQRGELTPQAMQSLQAAQAQAAQGVQARGGVGAAQATAQVEALRQQLLQQQYDYGLKLSGIGDNISLGAIKTGLEADKYVQQLSNSFYSNMAYIAAGMNPAAVKA